MYYSNSTNTLHLLLPGSLLCLLFSLMAAKLPLGSCSYKNYLAKTHNTVISWRPHSIKFALPATLSTSRYVCAGSTQR